MKNWRAGSPPPKRCPVCGFEGSADVLAQRNADVIARRKARHDALKVASVLALPIWRRWLIGLGLAKRPEVRWHRFTRKPGIQFTFCADCGVVERRDGDNNACTGKQVATLRAAEGGPARIGETGVPGEKA